MSGDLFRAVWESASDALAVSDADGRVLAANPAYFALYGFKHEEVIGRSFAVIFPAEQQSAALEAYRQFFREEVEFQRVESSVRRADGEERTVETRYDFIVEQGARVAMLSVIRDVTERKRVLRREQEEDRQRETFLATAAHDLKSPLTSIKGFAQLIRRRLDRPGPLDAPRLHADLEHIEITATRMGGLIDELLDAITMQMGHHLELAQGPTDLLALTRQVAIDQKLTTEIHTIEVSGDAAELVGHWDRDRLQRAISNLVSNAIKYSPDGGPIAVRVGTENFSGRPWAVLTIQDPGIGIPAADLPHVFERFHRGANAVGEIAGTGIGLAGVRQIVEQHGGTIDLESVEGQGTTVIVRLPIGAE